MKIFIAAILPLLLCGPGLAQPSCPASSQLAPAATLRSAATLADIDVARLNPGQAAIIGLHPARDVHFAAAPERQSDSSSFSGMVMLDVRKAGTYRISLSSGAWIDVVKDGEVVDSTSHNPGAECSPFRKIVSFPLTAGRHVIQLSGNKDAGLSMMVQRKD